MFEVDAQKTKKFFWEPDTNCAFFIDHKFSDKFSINFNKNLNCIKLLLNKV